MHIKHAIFSRVSGNGMRRRFILKIIQNLYLIILINWDHIITVRYLRMLIWFGHNLRDLNPRYSLFLVGFSLKTIFDPPRSRATLASKDLELYYVSFGLHEKFARGCPLTQTPTQKFKSWFLRFSSQILDSSLVSLKIIFGASKSELFRLKLHMLNSKIPEFNLVMWLFPSNL